jgi:hypothetical protein
MPTDDMDTEEESADKQPMQLVGRTPEQASTEEAAAAEKRRAAEAFRNADQVIVRLRSQAVPAGEVRHGRRNRRGQTQYRRTVRTQKERA